MKKTGLLGLFILVHLITTGQTRKGEKVVYGGVGVSLVSAFFGADLLNNYEWECEEKNSPVLMVGGDFSVTNVFSVGPSYSNQSLYQIERHASSGSYHTRSTMRQNFAVRLLFHIPENSVIDFYGGTRLGATLWNNRKSEFYHGESDELNKEQLNDEVWPSVQLVMGTRIYVSNSIAFNMEMAIGSPYFASAGLSLLIPNNKK